MGAGWHKVANAADVPAGGAWQVSVGNEWIAVYNFDGKFYATSDICTHEHANLSEGFIDGENLRPIMRSPGPLLHLFPGARLGEAGSRPN